ncbi:Peroxidase [Mycena sanguinolenta]|uniref:Peroxidase n=1 Tax=Mycena sanguinolenta TaxID=230812 RepID=A0A8H7CVC8_9AGAR|nr:Peroxidase [Mycena sanguinolenta]
MFVRPTFSILAIVLAPAIAYTWPSPQLDALEAIRYDQVGFNTIDTTLSSFVQPCNLYLFDSVAGGLKSGRSDAADWIRTAYHDMATHNISDGTGGLDASIRFPEEQARAENTGNGFVNTAGIVFAVFDRYVSMADSIALGALIAIESCGGPEIAFRGGRIDAGEVNNPGVPMPQESLLEHTQIFERQGFTPTEMIGLVACGHTFGGVQSSFFPDIANPLNDANDTEDVSHFDSTFVGFDNNIAGEYISGTTQNPLVAGFNQTTNSDSRIFGSDGNRTMRAFAQSPELFAATCADLYARMLDTVPRGVVLSEVIEPLPVKPSKVILTMNGDTLELSGFVRFWGLGENSTRTVNMLWENHNGGTGNSSLVFAGVSSSTGGKYTAAWYGFNPSSTFGFLSLDPVAGVKSLSFLVDGTLENQNGLGFAVQDSYMFSKTSCSSGAPLTGRLDVAVRNDANLTRLYIENKTFDSANRIVIVEVDVPRPAAPVAINSAYSLWSMNLTDQGVEFNLGAEIDGVKYSTAEAYDFEGFGTCST